MAHLAGNVLTASLSVALVVYLLSVAVYLVSVTVMAMSSSFPDGIAESSHPGLDAVTQIGFRLTRLGRLTHLLFVMALSLAWPAAIDSSFASRKSNVIYRAQRQLRPLDRRIALYTLGLVVVLDLLDAVDRLWAPARNVAMVAVLVSLAGRHLAYLIGAVSQRLRRSSFSPFASLLVVAAADAASLVLAVTSLRASVHGEGRLDWEAVRTSGVDVFNLPGTIADATSLALTQAVMAAFGLLFSVAILKSLKDRDEWRRTDEDLRNLADNCVVTGQVDKAEKWLDREEAHTEYSYRLRAAVAIARGRYDQALKHAARVALLQDNEWPEAPLLMLAELSHLVVQSDEQRVQLTEYIVDAGASDPVVSAAVLMSLLAMDDPDVVLDGLTSVLTEDRYPLALALAAAALGEGAEARAILARAHPGSEIDEVLRLLRACIFVLVDGELAADEAARQVAEWFERSLPAVQGLVPTLPAGGRPLALGSVLELRSTLIARDHVAWEEEAATLMAIAEELADSNEQLKTLSRIVEDVVAVGQR